MAEAVDLHDVGEGARLAHVDAYRACGADEAARGDVVGASAEEVRQLRPAVEGVRGIDVHLELDEP